MVDRLRNVWNAPDLRKKILITLGLLFIYRLVAAIPVPGIDPSTVSSAFQKNSSLNQIFGLLSVFSGGSISNFSIVGLGIYPYITASIVIQLLQPIIPALDRMQREGGEAGRNRLSQITSIVSVPLAFLQGFGQLVLFANVGAVGANQFGLTNGATFIPTLTVLMILTAGVMLLVWIGELITENGIGNGISLIIFTGIVAALPSNISKFFISSGAGSSSTSTASSTTSAVVQLVIIGIALLVLILLIVYVTTADRRIPVQYPSKRMIGGRRAMMETRQANYIPLKLNMGGMIPLIFAQSLLLFPTILATYIDVPTNKITWLRNGFSWLKIHLDPSAVWYPLVFFLFVFAFTYFYATIVWEQQSIAENLRKQGAFVAGQRPGAKTNEYLYGVLMRITLWGALFLALIAIAPYIIPGLSKGRSLTGAGGLISAASLIIIVQVAIDTLKQIQSQLVMRNYSGFLR